MLLWMIYVLYKKRMRLDVFWRMKKEMFHSESEKLNNEIYGWLFILLLNI